MTAGGPVQELLARAASRETVWPDDARAGAAYERVTVDGDAYFVKRLTPASDWIMRVTGDHVHRPYLVWQAGIMDRTPSCIDHTVVAMDRGGAGDHTVLTMLMHDVGRFLVPPGAHPDGRTILLDWAYPGAGPACWDLCWYLALNRARLPEPKETVIARFRAALEEHGINTGRWWQQQLDLCMIGIMATFGWEKALGDAAELGWWHNRVTESAARCGIGAGRASR